MARIPTDSPLRPAQLALRTNPDGLAILAAVKAVQRGTATEDQQRMAWTYITEVLCDTYGLSYRTNPRDTDFAEGKRFVGLQLIKLSKLSPALVRKKDDRRSSDGTSSGAGSGAGRDSSEQPD